MGDPPAEVNRLDAEIDALRQRTEALFGELKRRVGKARELVDVRAHPRAAAAVGAGTLALAGLAVWLSLSRRAHNRRLVTRVQRRAGAYRALLADPERALRGGPSLRTRMVSAVLVAAAATLTRRLLSLKMR